MWEIEPVEIKVRIQDKKPPERIAESEAYKIGLDPCYIIIHQEGLLGGTFYEFLYVNKKLYRVENTLSTTCEICGRLVVGKNNFPYEVSFDAKQKVKNVCDSCIGKYKGWDNYMEAKFLFGTNLCEDCGKPTNKGLEAKKIIVQVCEECINELTDMGFEKTIDSTSPQSALPFPIKLKGISKNKQIHKLKLTKYLTPYTEIAFSKPQEALVTSEESVDARTEKSKQKNLEHLRITQEDIKAKKEKIRKKVNKTILFIFSGFIIGCIGQFMMESSDTFLSDVITLIVFGGGALLIVVGIFYGIMAWAESNQ